MTILEIIISSIIIIIAIAITNFLVTIFVVFNYWILGGPLHSTRARFFRVHFWDYLFRDHFFRDHCFREHFHRGYFFRDNFVRSLEFRPLRASRPPGVALMENTNITALCTTVELNRTQKFHNKISLVKNSQAMVMEIGYVRSIEKSRTTLFANVPRNRGTIELVCIGLKATTINGTNWRRWYN